jgi:hypothetical protein
MVSAAGSTLRPYIEEQEMKLTNEEAEEIAHELRDEYRKHLRGEPSEWNTYDERMWKRDPKDWAWLNEGEDK